MPNNLLRSGFKAMVYVLVTIALTLGLGVTSVYAYYAPGETLNPTCAPNASGCDIDPTMPVTAGGTGLTNVSTGDLLYASASNTLSKLSIGNNGKILKVVGNSLSWEDDLGGTSYLASEQGVHLNTTTNIFSLVLNGNSLTQSSAGLSISPGYTGQSSIATLGTITSGTWSGTAIGSSYGGTGITATPAIGQILIGSGTGYNLGSLTAIATSGIKIANGASNINFSFDFNLLNSVTSASGSNDYLMVYNGASGSNKKITYADLFRDFEGSLKYQGIWNASTNVPDINSAATTSGFFYIVQTAGTSTVNGISDWSVGDWVVYSSTGWEKVQSTNLVNSVFGRVGTIVAEYGDYSADKITTVTSTKLSATNVQAAIDEIVNSMQSTIATSTTGTYYRGDKTWVTLDTAAVLENAGYLYFTNDRAREALSVATGQGFSFDTSTGIFALDANRSLPYKGNTFGEMLVWDGTNWVSTSTVANYISGLGVSNFTTNTISQWANDIGYLTIASSTGNNLFWNGSSLAVTSSPSFDSLSLLTNGLYLASSSPAGTTSTLYNLGGKLYFNGAPVNSSATIDSGSATGQIAYWNGSGWIAGPSLVLSDGLLSLEGTVSSTNIINTGTVTTTDLNAININTTNVTSTSGWFTNLLSSLSAYFTNLMVDNATTTNLVATGSTTLANLNVNGDTVLSTTTISDLIANALTVSGTSTLNNSLFVNGNSLLNTTSISYLNVTGNSAFNTITSGTWNGNAIGIAYGGLGITSTPGFGKILMGDGSGYLLGAITVTSGLSVFNSTGTIELSLNIPSLKLSNTMDTEDQFIFYSSSSNSNQRISYNDVFGSVLGSLNYRGTWNPITNNPTISIDTCTSTSKGYYYVASTSTTSSAAVAGLDTWTANDWLVCNGANWERIQTTNAVSSVFGRTGAITAESGDYDALKIDFSPTSSISSTNVQAAIKELAEKTGSSGGNLGDILSWNGTKWTSTSTLSLSNGNIYFTGNLIPSAPGVFDIGSETNFVRDLYISSNSLKIAGQSLSNDNGILSWGGTAMNVGGFSVAGDNSTSTGSMSVGGALTVAGQSAFAGDITANGSMLLTGNVTSSQIYATTGTFANLLIINPATFANLNWTNATGTNLIITGNTTLATTTMLGLTITQNGLIIASSTPNTTTQALYALGSELYWNGSKVGSGGGLDWATTTVDSIAAPFGLTPNSTTSTGIGTDGLAMWLGTSSTARVYVDADGLVMIGTTTVANSPTKTGSTTPSFMTINGKTTVFGDLVVYGNIIPGITDTYSLGSTSTEWKDLAVSSSTMYIGGVPLANNSGSLTWNNTTVGASTAANLNQQLTYGENISIGDLIQVNSAGNAVKIVTTTSGSNTTIATVGSQSVADSVSPAGSVITAYLSDNKFVIIYTNAASTTMYGRIGQYTGDTVTWGTAVSLLTAASAPVAPHHVVPINGGAGFAVYTQHNQTNSNDGITVASVSGLNITNVVNNALGSTTNMPGAVIEVATNRLAEIFNIGGNLYCFIKTVNSNNSLTSVGNVSNSGYNTSPAAGKLAAVKVDNNKVVVVLTNSGNYLYAIAIDTSGSTPILGATSLNALGSDQVAVASYDTNKFIAFGRYTSNNKPYAYTATVSGTTITLKNSFSLVNYTNGTVNSYLSAASPNTNSAVLAIEHGTSAGELVSLSITPSTEAIALINTTTFGISNANHDSNSWLSYLAPGRLVLGYKDYSNSGRPTVQAVTMGSSTVVSQGALAGIAQTAGSAGTVGTVTMLGGVSTIHSGLTPGSLYYIQSNGTLGTDNTGYVVGRAISTTTLSMADLYNSSATYASTNAALLISSADGTSQVTTQYAGTTNDALRFFTNNIQRMVVENSGVVSFYGNGISILPGTPSTTGYAMYSDSDGKLYWNGSVLASPTWAANWNTTTLGIVGLAPTSSAGVGLGSDGGNLWMNAGGSMRFYIASTTGYVGIGTSTLATSSILTVSGTSTILGNLVVNGSLITLFSSTDFTTTSVYANDVNFGTNMNIRVNATSSNFYGITGIAGGTNGREITIVNASSTSSFIIYNQSSSSTAANRIITGTGSDLTVAADATVLIKYDSISSRWRVVGGTGGSSQTSVTTASASTTLTNLSFGSTQKINAAAGTVVLTLPTASGSSGKSIEFIKSDLSTNVALILPTGSETIGGSTALGLYNTNDAVTLRSDGTNWQIVSDNRSSVGQSNSYYSASMQTAQTSNLTSGDHVKFDTSGLYNGSDITLDTATTYTNATNVASRGRFTLKGGKIYHLVGQIPYMTANSGGFIEYAWYNVDAGGKVGNQVNLETNNSATADFRSGYSEAVVSPLTDTRYELRLMTSATSTQIGTTGNLVPTAYIEVISQPAAVVNTVDYGIVRYTGSDTSELTTGQKVNFDSTIQSGNMTYGSSMFTLVAGKTYELEAQLEIYNTSGSAGGVFGYYNYTNGALLPNARALEISTTGANQNMNQAGMITAIITPTSTIQVGIKFISSFGNTPGIIGSAGTATNGAVGGTYFKVTQIGSTGYTGIPFNYLGAALANGSLDNTNYDQTWSWSTETTSTAMTLNANALTTGSILAITSNSSALSSTNGLLYVANTGTATSGILASFVASTTAKTGLFVLNNGNVGIGTISPLWKLEVNESTATNLYTLVTARGGNSLVAGTVFRVKDASGTSRGGTIGSDGALTNPGLVLSGSTSLGGTNNHMVINSTGNVGIGTVSPDVLFNVETTKSDSAAFVSIENLSTSTAADGLAIKIGTSTPGSGNQFIYFVGSASQRGSISGNGSGGTAFNQTSDGRLKENITSTHYGLSDLLNIQVRDFNFIGINKQTTGFIAQDLEKIYPEAVSTNGDNGLVALSKDSVPWQVDYGKLTPLLVKAIQEEHSLNASTTLGLQLDLSANDILTNANTLAMFGTTTINALDLTNSSTLFATDTLAIDTEVSSTISGMAVTTTVVTNGVTTTVAVTSTIDYIKSKIVGGYSYLHEFVAVRVDAVTGWFDQIFARKVNSDEVKVKDKFCIGDTCITQDQLKQILDKSNQTSSQSYSTNSSSSDNSSSQSDNTTTTGNTTGSTTTTLTTETETTTSTVVVTETVNTENTNTSGSTEDTTTGGDAGTSSTELDNSEETIADNTEEQTSEVVSTNENSGEEVSGN